MKINFSTFVVNGSICTQTLVSIKSNVSMMKINKVYTSTEFTNSLKVRKNPEHKYASDLNFIYTCGLRICRLRIINEKN